MTITAVVFDLYGTLAEVSVDEASSSRWRSLATELRRSGVAVDASGIELRQRYEDLCATAAAAGRSGRMLPWVFRQILLEAGAEGSRDQVTSFAGEFRYATTEKLALREYAPQLLAELRSNGIRLGLLSNTEAIVTRFDLERLRLGDSFDAVVLSSEAGTEKPSTDIYRAAMEQLRVGPDESVMVGDNWSTDVEGALRVGMRALHLDQKAASGAITVPADRVVSVHPDLASITGGLRALGLRHGIQGAGR
jgi:putative hydrolase of the HAD superfamily